MGRTSAFGYRISLRVSSSEIILPEIGSYELGFYALMLTNITDIMLGGDYIQVSLFYTSNNVQSFISDKYDYNNIGKPNTWNKKLIEFSALERTIRVNFILFI